MPPLSSPVAYFVFNRPQHTRETFAAIRAQRPSRLLIIADGPRPGSLTDSDRCQEVRQIVEQIDWPCDVQRNYAEVNLGCARRVGSGLDWVFSEVESAIILEDDCLATPDFFRFCDILLERYKDEERVWTIGANCYKYSESNDKESYYFSKYPDIWGWATWRRAWKHYQADIPFLENWKQSAHWNACFPTEEEGSYWSALFAKARSGQIDTWDYSWLACVLHGGGLAATPTANLVKNIGFDEFATHTLTETFKYELSELKEIAHPPEITVNTEADEMNFRHLYRPKASLVARGMTWIRRKIPAMVQRRG